MHHTSNEQLIQLASINSFGKIVLMAEALSFLRQLSPPIAIVSLVGPPQTGKTFLMSQLLSQPSAQSKSTRGLWVWNKPILASDPQGKVVNIVLVDSQGFPKGQESRLMSLVLLSSNIILYNSPGSISPTVMQHIQPLVALSRECDQPLKTEFHWVLRDYGAPKNQLGQSIPPDHYLQSCLTQIQQTHRGCSVTAKTIKQKFAQRHCHCLSEPTPLLEEQPPLFNQQIITLRKKISQANSTRLDGASLAMVIETYVSSLNEGSSLDLAYAEGKDCQTRIECLDRLNQELRSMSQGSIGHNDTQQISESLGDLRRNLNEFYKQKMKSRRQISALDSQINSIFEEYQQAVLDVRPVCTRSREVVRLQVPKFVQKGRVSIGVLESMQEVPDNDYIPGHKHSLSVSQMHTNKNLQARLTEYETKLYRYELEAESSIQELEGIRSEWEKSKRDLQSKVEEKEELANKLAMNQKEYKAKVEELQEEKVRLERALKIAQSEVDKTNILSNEKELYLKKEIEEMENSWNIQRKQSQEQHVRQLAQLMQQKQQHAQSYEEQIEHYKNLLKNATANKPQSAKSINSDPGALKVLEEKESVISSLRQQVDKLTLSKSELQTGVNQWRVRLQEREKYYQEASEQAVRRAQQKEKHLEKIHGNLLQGKEQMIKELKEKVEELMRNRHELEMDSGRVVSSKNQEIAQLEGKLLEAQKVIADNRATMTQLQRLNEASEEDHSLLLRRYQLQRQQLDDLQGRCSEKDKQLTKAVSLNDQLKELIEINAINYQSQIDSLNHSLDKEKQAGKEQKKRHEERLAQTRQLNEQEKSRLNIKLTEMSMEVDLLKGVQCRHEQMQEEWLMREVEMQEELQRRALTLKQLDEKNTELVSELQQQRQQNEAKSNILQSKIAQLETNNENLQDQHSQLQYQLTSKTESSQSSLQTAQTQIFNLKQENQKEKRTWLTKEQELKRAISKLQSAGQQQNQQQDKEMEKVKAHKENLMRQKAIVETQKAVLEQKLKMIQDSSAVKLTALTQNQEKVQKQLNQLQKQNKKVKIQHQKVISKQEDYQGQIKSLQQKIKVLQNQREVTLSNYQQQAKDQSIKNKQFQIHLSLYQEKVSQLRIYSNQLEQKVREVQADHQRVVENKELMEQNYDRDRVIWQQKLDFCKLQIGKQNAVYP